MYTGLRPELLRVRSAFVGFGLPDEPCAVRRNAFSEGKVLALCGGRTPVLGSPARGAVERSETEGFFRASCASENPTTASRSPSPDFRGGKEYGGTL